MPEEAMTSPCQQGPAIVAIQKSQERLEHKLFGNGQPGIEAQMGARIDAARAEAAKALAEQSAKTDLLVKDLYGKIDKLNDKMGRVITAVGILAGVLGVTAPDFIKGLIGN